MVKASAHPQRESMCSCSKRNAYKNIQTSVRQLSLKRQAQQFKASSLIAAAFKRSVEPAAVPLSISYSEMEKVVSESVFGRHKFAWRPGKDLYCHHCVTGIQQGVAPLRSSAPKAVHVHTVLLMHMGPFQLILGGEKNHRTGDYIPHLQGDRHFLYLKSVDKQFRHHKGSCIIYYLYSNIKVHGAIYKLTLSFGFKYFRVRVSNWLPIILSLRRLF